MKLTRFLFHFFGSVHFAVSILLCLIVFVSAGTIIESYTESHLFAERFTYGNPVFTGLLWMMFVNILFAALRRWPFKFRHVPFLLTHLGLLMILGGSLIKAHYGTQGQMLIVEGSGSEEILIPDSYVLSLEDKNGNVETYPLSKRWQVPNNDYIEIAGFYPHHKTKLKVWPVGPAGWRVVKVDKGDFEKALEKELFNDLKVKIIDRNKGVVIEERPVQDSRYSFHYKNGSITAGTSLEVPLEGPMSLMTLNYNDHLRGSPSEIIEFKHPLTALIAEDTGGNYQLATIDRSCRIKREELSGLAVYDKGFGGVYMLSTLPSFISPESGMEKEFCHKEALRRILSQSSKLSPPLELIRTGCSQNYFPEKCIGFLSEWDRANCWILPQNYSLTRENQKLLERIDWSSISSEDLKSGFFSSTLLLDLKNVSLDDPPWKYLLSKDQPERTYEQTIIEQLFLIGSDLPDPPDIADLSTEEKARILTIILRAYGIHLKNLIPPEENNKNDSRFEFPVTPEYLPETPSTKLEENLPLIMVRFKDGLTVPAGFDRYGLGLKWPVSDHKYLMHFRPEFQQLPYHIRLRTAREHRYPGSNAPFSYEADIIVSGLNGDDPREATLSMNYVYETWDGYRFYLAGIHSKDKERAKSVQLVVNYDPARYRLTYPGGIVVALGIILLLWRPGPFRRR
jgi:hypothetical protein